MRLLIFLFLSTLSTITGINVTQSFYSSGIPTIGGCSNPITNYTYTIGICYPDGKGNSWMMNDCWNNGVGSISYYQGTSCLATNASSLSIFGANNYCNAGINQNTTYTCDSYTQPISTQVVRVTSYPLTNGGCNGTAFPQTTDFPIGICTAAYGTTQTYILANCINGVPSAVIYSTSDCSVTFNATTGYINSTVNAAGIWVQKGVTSTTASNCNKTPVSYDEFQCITLSTSSSGETGNSSSGAGSSGAGSSGAGSSGAGSSGADAGSSSTTNSTSSTTGNSTTSTPGNTTTSSTGTIIISSSSTGQNNNNGAIMISISFATIMFPLMTVLQPIF